jgi:ubiquinone/menaquinone biosynthesis C-methylase UbiE
MVTPLGRWSDPDRSGTLWAVATDYDEISDEYRRSRQAPWRAFVEVPSFLGLVGDVTGRSALDLACGEGSYTRRLAAAGATRVVGVDSSAAMIRLADEAGVDGGDPQLRRIEYRVADAADLELGERFDLVTAAYLLDYAAEAAGQLALCRTAARHLAPGGRFVGITINPQIDDPGLDYRAYGFERLLPEGVRNGASLTFRNYQDATSFDVTVYYLDTATYEGSFVEAGLDPPRWVRPSVSEEGAASFAPGYWDTFVQDPPVVLFESRLGAGS